MTIYTITYVILFIYEAEVEQHQAPTSSTPLIHLGLFINGPLNVIGCFSTIASLSYVWINWNLR